MRRCYYVLLFALLGFAQAASAGTLVVIVNRNSGVEHLTRYQVLDIFLARYRKLPSGLTAIPLDIAGDSAERKEFYQFVARKDLAEMSSYWARLVFAGQATPPYPVADSRAAVDLVATNQSAIAYVDRSAVDSRVKVVLELVD